MTHPTRRPSATLIALGLALPLIATTAPQIAAEPKAAATPPTEMREVTLEVLAPWEGKGEVFQIGPDTLLFLGPYEGIMYIKTGTGELDSAIFICPATTEIRQFEDRIDSRGHCAITSSKGDLAFATFTCTGGRDSCRGEFVVTGGNGALEGIEGHGELIVRTALRSMVEDATTGTLISSVEGLAVWPALRLRVPVRPADAEPEKQSETP